MTLKNVLNKLVDRPEVLYPLATAQKEIDLYDGVKVNFPKFGKALKKITGPAVKES